MRKDILNYVKYIWYFCMCLKNVFTRTYHFKTLKTDIVYLKKKIDLVYLLKLNILKHLRKYPIVYLLIFVKALLNENDLI